MRRLAIQNSLKCTATLQIFIDPHWYFIVDTGLILRSIELFIYIQTEENINHHLAVVFNGRYRQVWLHLSVGKQFDRSYCTMLHLFDDLWLDKIIPKNNDEGRAIYGNLENKINTLRRLSYRLQYFFISDSVKVKLCNNRLHNATVCFFRYF
jgi:hypothetical protein